MSLWGELKRLNVYKVGVAYAIVAWLLIQGVAIISPARSHQNHLIILIRSNFGNYNSLSAIVTDLQHSYGYTLD